MAANIMGSMTSSAIATSIGSSTTSTAAITTAASSSSSSLIGLSIASWYSASLANNYATPTLLDIIGSPLTLNMLEQAAMILVALVALPANGIRLLPNFKTLNNKNIQSKKNNDQNKNKAIPTIHIVLAMGLANAITARWFMVSLQHLPLSLCQTIRACSPCVAAVIGIFRGKHFSNKQLAAIPVIVAGFALAVSAQPSCSKVGVYAAIGSLLAMSALQHLSKELLERGMHEIQCQFLQCSLCLFFLAVEQSPRDFYIKMHNNKDTININNNYQNPFRTVWNLAMDCDPQNRARTRQFRLLTVLNGASDYVENVAATKACAVFDELTFSIFDTLRRLSVILICGMGLRKNPAKISNIAGTVLVLVGALLYQQGSSSSSGNNSSTNNSRPGD